MILSNFQTFVDLPASLQDVFLWEGTHAMEQSQYPQGRGPFILFSTFIYVCVVYDVLHPFQDVRYPGCKVPAKSLCGLAPPQEFVHAGSKN